MTDSQYFQPAPAKTIKLGSYGQAFDLAGDRRAYTYKHQPGNQAAWRIGDASSRVEAGGDLIDRGLSLLKVLEAGGFGVFELDETAAIPAPAPSWTVSIAGPDDVHRFDTELDALRFANQVNRTYLADLLAHPGDEVLCLATVSDASPALPTSPLRDTGVETPLLHTDRLNLVGRWFEGRGMTTMAHICRTAAAELKTIADRREEAVAKIVSSGPADLPLLQWLSADHSFRAPIGSRLYAAPPSQPKSLEDLMTKIQAFGLACYQHESGAEQIAMQDEIRIDLAALTASQVVDFGCDIKISAPAIPAPEGGHDWTDVRMELEAAGRDDLSTWVADRAALAAQPQAALAYQQANPLGGPAKVFHAMADAVEAGDSYEDTLRRFGYAEVVPASAGALQAENAALRLAFDVRRWDQRLHDAWSQAIPNVQKALSDLLAAALAAQPQATPADPNVELVNEMVAHLKAAKAPAEGDERTEFDAWHADYHSKPRAWCGTREEQFAAWQAGRAALSAPQPKGTQKPVAEKCVVGQACECADGSKVCPRSIAPEAQVAAQAPAPAPEQWLPMESAPKDGSLLRLLVEFTEHATEDQPEPSPTIGSNSLANTGIDEWLFAGWCWTHDRFTQGEGKPVGWLPMLAAVQAPAVHDGKEQP